MIFTKPTKTAFNKKSSVCWEASTSERSDMRAPARIYATETMLDDILADRSAWQLMNTTTLPGVVGTPSVMPDAHEGYGFPIGGVVATNYPDGVISPGGIGYDINCGVRLLRSTKNIGEVERKLEKLSLKMHEMVPSGVGRGGPLKLSLQELDAVLKHGVSWMVKHHYASEEDQRHIESAGHLDNADPDCVSEAAKRRGLDQLGTLGSGNHFCEVDVVDEIFDEETANAFGLWKGQVVILIHTGSRGLGHQVATDYIKIMLNVMETTYGITLPDRELACVPFSSPEGQRYFNAMCAAANFAWANRQMITWEIRQAWQEIFGKEDELSLVYDVAHNIAKIETHLINGKHQKVIVHRKGATRAFPAGHQELAPEYRSSGQPVLIPGSMGTASYVLVGTEGGMQETFGSSCHGAGRTMSRKAAMHNIDSKQLYKELRASGIFVQTSALRDLAEEAPRAYKDVNEVVNVVHEAGIAKRVARLRPRAVIKG